MGWPTVPHSYAMRPIICDCRECRPERAERERATKKYLLDLLGPPEYDWEDLEKRDRESRAKERGDTLGFGPVSRSERSRTC